MSNIEDAKKSLERTAQIENIINPPPKPKRVKLPLARDMNLIQSIIKEKLEEKEKTEKEKHLAKAKTDWENEINAIHQKAINLRKEAETLANTIKTRTQGAVTIDIDNYGHYWHDLPKTMADAQDDKLLQINEESMPAIITLKKEIDKQILDMKLGLRPIADVKILLTEIDKLN